MANKQEATFAGGCFWCIEAAFNMVEGVTLATSGYSGGKTVNPSYQEVISGHTGHAEAVHVEFDADTISYEQLLAMFFQLHDPTTLNRQGNDVGTQYRSMILTHNKTQQQLADSVIDYLNTANIWDSPIVTEVQPFNAFYPAESFHQDYVNKNPNQPYCQILIGPKLAQFKTKFGEFIKKG